ncbi:MltA-interacting MipA family protein [Enterobacterales bacterium CwR94]|nr:MltA-interacting MipA family protein [Enterobacterales bacterium CwR94]
MHPFTRSTLCFTLLACQPALANSDPQWSGTLGVGAGVSPEFAGARDDRVNVRPVIRLNYGPFFIGSVADITAVGWRFARTEHWVFATGIGSDFFPRKASDSDHLRGLGDISVTPRAFVSATYHQQWLRAGLITTQDIGGNDQGFTLTGYAHLQWQASAALRLFAGPSLTWGDSDYQQTQYGVNAEQAAQSGLPAFTAGSGLEKGALESGLDYRITQHWLTGVRISAERLQESAADSPITQQRNQLRYGAFISWQFGQ